MDWITQKEDTSEIFSYNNFDTKKKFSGSSSLNILMCVKGVKGVNET